MREILTITMNDIRSTFRERGSIISLFVVPVFITVFLGIATAGGSNTVYYDVLRSDPADPLAGQFIDLLRQEGGHSFVVCDLNAPTTQDDNCKLKDIPASADLRALAEERVKTGITLAGIVLPNNFNADLKAGKQVILTFLEKSGLNAPTLIRQQVDAVITRINGSALAARVIVEKANPAADQKQTLYDNVYASADKLWASNPVLVADQPNIPGDVSAGTGFGQSSPGMGAMFVLLNALGLGAVFIQERQSGTLQRLLVLPIPKWRILAGKLLGRYALGLIIFAVMLAVGTAFNVRWGDPFATVIVVLVYTLAVTCIALAFSTLVKTQSQAAGLSLLLALTLAPLGGAWWPLSIVPTWMQVIGRISPIAWSQDAFNKLIFYGGHLPDILVPLGVLLLISAIFFLFGVRRFRYQ